MDDFRIKAALILFLLVNFVLFRQPGRAGGGGFDTPRSVFKKEPPVHKRTHWHFQSSDNVPAAGRRFEMVGFSVKDLEAPSNSAEVPVELSFKCSATPTSTTALENDPKETRRRQLT